MILGQDDCVGLGKRKDGTVECSNGAFQRVFQMLSVKSAAIRPHSREFSPSFATTGGVEILTQAELHACRPPADRPMLGRDAVKTASGRRVRAVPRIKHRLLTAFEQTPGEQIRIKLFVI